MGKPSKEIQQQEDGMTQSFRDVSNNFKEYYSRVTKVHSINEWMQLNQQLLNNPLAGIDQAFTGAVFGFCSGIAARKTFQFVSILTGVGFAGIQFLNYYGYVNVDWKKIQNQFEKTLDLNKDGKIDSKDLDVARKKLMHVLTWGLPCAGGFASGFLIGFKARL